MSREKLKLIGRIRQMISGKPVKSDYRWPAVVDSTVSVEATRPAEFEVTEQYRKIEKWLVDGVPLILVSGRAGTGKSTLIQYLRSSIKKNIVVLAPTGIAALNVQGSTIHSFFKFPPRILTNSDIKAPRNRTMYKAIDILVIDEISMVRADAIDAIDAFLRSYGKNSKSPFGGVQLVCIGDLYQLPPVVSRSEEAHFLGKRYSGPFFFNGQSIDGMKLATIELSKTFRQSDAEFIGLLDLLRTGTNIDYAIEKINERVAVASSSNSDAIILTTTNASADQMNAGKLRDLPGEYATFVGQVSGSFSVQDERLPSPQEIHLKVGARVMFTKNDDQKRWVNGTVGQVTSIATDYVRVKLLTEHPGIVVDVQRAVWESFQYSYDSEGDRIDVVSKGQYRQLPLMLGWAVTIHKSQGKTLDNVRIDLGDGAFAAGQVYVALSRCRTLEGIELSRPIEREDVIVDERVRRFFSDFSIRGI